MTRFSGGPADGVTLTLKRSPHYLRVVTTVDSTGIDALDALDDTPRPDETVTVYRLIAHHGSAFVDGRDKQGRRTGYRCEVASYEYLDQQPAPEHLRDNDAWSAWANGPGRELIEEAKS